jgi:hypothetical protein
VRSEKTHQQNSILGSNPSGGKSKVVHKEEKGVNSDKPTVRIMSSTGKSAKVIHLDTSVSKPQMEPQQKSTKVSQGFQVDTTANVARQLFVDTEMGVVQYPSPSFSKGPKHCSTPVKHNSVHGGRVDAQTSPSPAGKKGQKEESGGESLLCAMLVGGSEVTKSYEQSRDHLTPTQTKNPGSVDGDRAAHGESEDRLPRRSASHCSNAANTSLDSLFDDEAPEALEIKPYELPELCRLPQLKNINMAVLELTKTEGRYSEGDLPEVKRLKGHSRKQQDLLDLISRVKGSVPLEDRACKEAEEVLMNVSRDDEEVEDKEEEMTEQASTSDVQNAPCVEAIASTSTGDKDKDSNAQGSVASEKDIMQDTSADVCTSGSSAVAAEADAKHCENNDVAAAAAKSIADSETPAALTEETKPSDEAKPGSNISKLDCGPESTSGIKEETMQTVSGITAVTMATEVMDTERGQGSPSSLGELDPAQMTEAATLAVQNKLMVGSKKLVSSGSNTPTFPGNSMLCEPSTSGTSHPSTSGLSQPSASRMCLPSTSSSHQLEDKAVPGCSKEDAAVPTGSKSYPQPRTFFSRVASPSKFRWRPKTETSTAPASRPGWSKWHTIQEPQPIAVLTKAVNSRAPKWTAFASRDLDSYLRDTGNKQLLPASRDSQLARFLLDEGYVKSHQELEKQLTSHHSSFSRR